MIFAITEFFWYTIYSGYVVLASSVVSLVRLHVLSYPHAYTLGRRIEEKLNNLLCAIDNRLPGKAQELRDSKDCTENYMESKQSNEGD